MNKKKTLQDKAEAAFKKAVKEVVARYKKSGRKLAVWKDGRVRRIIAK